MARAMWRGAIQFGLVTIPVKLYVATEARGGLSFNLLHRECLSRIQMKTHCPIHGEISRSDTVRGYEYTKGQYVVIDEEDFEAVPLKTLRAIEIELFVDASRDSHGANFVRQAYYIEPEAIGRKAFYLLKSVLADEGLSAICKIVLKDREALASLNPYANTMLLSTLYWPDEVRSVAELDLSDEEEFKFKPAEKQMAQQLVAAMKGDFSADEYRDDYRQALMAVIEAKIEGQPHVPREVVEQPTRVTDLMKVLEASVAAARQERSASAAEILAAQAPAEASPAEAPPAEKRARREKKPTPLPAGRKAARTKESVAASSKPAGSDVAEPVRAERRRKSA
ncbi:MAG TPA: Ku protein [Candidatus Caenarcaniphilales bacterium]|nr:Ku protein [Candidatus Caenarcaniphilales bacterium]